VAWLEKKGYQFKKIDVLSDDMRRISRQFAHSTLETADSSVLPDFDIAQLEKFMLGNDILP